MPTIHQIRAPEDVKRCYPVMVQLRTHLTEEAFVERALRQLSEQPYHLAAVLENDMVVAVAGYRYGENLVDGRYMYVDDLVTDEAHRSQQYGGLLFDWLVDEARRNGCVHFSLDSGVHRFAAHRFYLNKRMEIRSHHFSLPLGSGK